MEEPEGLAKRSKIQVPSPSETSSDLTQDDGCQTRNGVENPVDDGDTQSTLMDKIQIPDDGDNERFVSTCGKPLKNSSGEEITI
jgi:hypothetical protein